MRGRNEVLVGVVVLIGIAVVVLGTIWLRGVAVGRGQIEIRARFNEVGQLLEGNSVKLRGVPIGRIDRIALDSAGRGVIVTMRVDGQVGLPEDPVVLLSPESMFGDWQAEIAPRAAAPTFPFAEAPDPNVLPGYALPDISRLTAVADRIAENLAVLTDRIELAFTEETALRVRRAVDNILDATEQITEIVGDQESAVIQISTDLQAATTALVTAANAANRIFAQVEVAVGEDRLVTLVEDVSRTASRTAALADTLLVVGRDMRIAAATADSTLATIGGIAAAIESGEGSLGRLVTDTTLFISLRESNLELQALLRDIRQNPRKYINVRVF
jgi:phospholipid/cholesterol/gamma-HCH transport system substrate-binding protein